MPRRAKKLPPLPAYNGQRAVGHRHWAYAGENEEYRKPELKEGKVLRWTNSQSCLRATRSGTH